MLALKRLLSGETGRLIWPPMLNWRHKSSFLCLQVPRLALKTPFRGGTVQDLAIRMVQLSREGLQRRRKAEENFLAPLMEIAEVGYLRRHPLPALQAE